MFVPFWNHVMVLNLVGDSMAIPGSVDQLRVASEMPKCQKRIDPSSISPPKAQKPALFFQTELLQPKSLQIADTDVLLRSYL